MSRILVRTIGGAITTPSGPLTLAAARALHARLSELTEQVRLAVEAAENWRRAAGWTHPEAADASGFSSGPTDQA